jgi:predicted secreted hydrolase
VRGAAWYDHEYGSSVLEEGTQGWEWFGLRLDDGRELMLFVLRDARGAPIPASAATLVERDGTPRALARADFTLAASGASWTNPATGARYPTAWRIEVPSAGLALEVAAEVEACELVSQATGVAYWEGPVRVRGSATGRGYGELTGFAGSMAGRF